jgi:hypothetical protein
VRHAEELGVRGEQMVALVVRLLTLRDPAFAGHAAAVAHHARALAEAAGLTEHERDVVHAAGLDARYVELFLTAVPRAAGRPVLEDELPVLRRALGLLGTRPAAG